MNRSKLYALGVVMLGAAILLLKDSKAMPDFDEDEEDTGRDEEGGGDPDPDVDEDPTPDWIVDLQAIAPADKRKASREPWAVVLHQMGFSRGDDPTRYKKVTAQFIITPDGTVAQLHPITSRLNSSNGFNEGGIAIEFAGNLPSRTQSQNPSHFYKPEKFGADQLTKAQVLAGRQLIRWLRDVALPGHGLELKVVVGHRQSSGLRGNDPGPDLWSNVGQWSVDNLGLSDGGDGFKVGSGKSIPDKWRTAPRIA